MSCAFLMMLLSPSYSSYGLEYGDLEALHPLETFNQIKARRESNWTIFKALCDSHKVTGQPIFLDGGTIELYHIDTQKIYIDASQTLIINGNNFELKFYPFVPRLGYNYVFDLNYGGTLSIKNGSAKVAQRQNYFESYQCVLKKSTNTKLIELPGTVGSDFWTSLSVGREIFYSWDYLVLGKTNTIASWDATAKTITLNNDIDAAVSNDMQGSEVWFGLDFVDGVSEQDYFDFGRHWVRGENLNVRTFSFIYNGPAPATGTDTVVTLQNVTIENFKYPVSFVSGAFKIYLFGTIEINSSEIALQVFARSQINRQSILGPNATLIFNDNGLLSVGSLDVISSGNIWGSGAYIHPTVIVQIDTFRGYNNPAATFRQFSSSIEIVCPGDYESWINDFQCVGSGELDLRTSNCMPFTCEYFSGDSILTPGGDFILQDGVIGQINLTGLFHPPDSVSALLQFNNAVINEGVTIGWPILNAPFTDIEFNNCIFYAERSADRQEKIKNDGDIINSITLNNCEYRKPVGSTVGTWTPGDGTALSGDACSSFLRPVNFKEITVNNLVTDYMIGAFLQQSSSFTIPPQSNSFVEVNDSDINLTKSHDANYVSTRTFLSDQIRGDRTSIKAFSFSGHGYNTPLRISPKIASRSANILTGSQTYKVLVNGPAPPTTFSVDNVLEIDFDHNEYLVNTGTIKHIAPITYSPGSTQKYSSGSAFSGTITIRAVGGTVTISKWDSATNEWGNVLSDIVIPVGTSANLTCDNKGVISKASNSTVNTTLATGTGAVTTYSGVLPDYLLVDSVGFEVTAGVISGVAGISGLIVGTGIDPVSYVDYGTGTYYIKFTSNLSNGVDLNVTYDKYNTWRVSGVFDVAA